MVDINTLHYEFELQRNIKHTSIEKDESSVDIDAYLNNAKAIILKNYTKIVEKNKSLERELRTLEITDKPLEKLKSGSLYDIYKLPEDYYSDLNLSIMGNCKSCEEIQPILNIIYTNTDSLNESLKDSFRKPDWYFRRVLVNFDSQGLLVYHDSKINVSDVKLTYVKYLADVACASCTKENAYLASDQTTSITEDKHLMLDQKGYLWRMIVNIAVVLSMKDQRENISQQIDLIMFNQNVGSNTV